jgi:hypothetical protein
MKFRFLEITRLYISNKFTLYTLITYVEPTIKFWVDSCEISREMNGNDPNFLDVSLLLATSPLLHTLLPPSVMCDIPEQEAHQHILTSSHPSLVFKMMLRIYETTRHFTDNNKAFIY